MKRLDRRSFLRTTLLSTTSFSLFPALAAETGKSISAQASATARVIGANGNLRCAVVGFNGRGRSHLEDLARIKGTRLVALCDVDSKVLGRELDKCKTNGKEVAGYTDIRKLLENKDIDVV